MAGGRHVWWWVAVTIVPCQQTRYVQKMYWILNCVIITEPFCAVGINRFRLQLLIFDSPIIFVEDNLFEFKFTLIYRIEWFLCKKLPRSCCEVTTWSQHVSESVYGGDLERWWIHNSACNDWRINWLSIYTF